MGNALSYQEFMSLSKENYANGGDGYYECWDEKTFDEHVKMFGCITKRKALQMYKQAYEVYQDRIGS